jgi:hypothetical protein
LVIASANDASDTVAVRVSDPKPTYGETETFTATVGTYSPALGTPGGTIQFLVDGAPFGSVVTLVSGVAASSPTSTLPAGRHKISAIYSGDPSYAANTAPNVPVTVAKAPLTIAADPKTKLYGQANPALTATYTGFVNNETPAVLTTPARLTTTARTSSPVGSYGINVRGATAANYSITFTSSTLTVTPAHLAVTAQDQGMAHYDTVPTLTYSITGFVNGDTSAAITGAPALSTTATSNSPAGLYPIDVALGTLAAKNYDFPNLVPGTLTVRPKVMDVRVDWGNQSMSLLGLNRDLPFVDIKAIDVIFSDDVTVDAASLALTGTTVKTYNMNNFSYNSATHDATWTLPTAIGIDHLKLALDGSSPNGIHATTPSVIMMGNYNRSFAVLPGDFNGDGVVNSPDIVGIRNEILGVSGAVPTVWGDLNGDGVVDMKDYREAQKRIGWKL